MAELTVDRINYPFLDNVKNSPLYTEKIDMFNINRNGIKTSLDILSIPRQQITTNQYVSLYTTMIDASNNLYYLTNGKDTKIVEKSISILESIPFVQSQSRNPIEINYFNSNEDPNDKLIVYPSILSPESSIFLSSIILKEMTTENDNYSLYTADIIPLLSELIIINETDLSTSKKAIKRQHNKLLEAAHILKSLQKDLDLTLSIRDRQRTISAFRYYTNYFNNLYHALSLFSKYLNNPNSIKNYISNILTNKEPIGTILPNPIEDIEQSYKRGIYEYKKIVK